MQETQPNEYDYVSEKYIRNNELKEKYIKWLNYESTKTLFNLLNATISECTNESGVQSCVSEFVNIIHYVSAPLFKKSINLEKKKKKKKNSASFSNEKQNPWYNNACQEQKYCFYIC